MMGARLTRIAIVAFGMEHCRRGVEAHARMLFEKLKLEPNIKPFLIKGSGSRQDDEIVLSVPKRDTWLNLFLGKIRGYNVYWEQVWFMIRLGIFLLMHARKLDVVYTQEYVHLIGMGTLKKIFKWNFKLVYCEGFVSSNITRVKYADALHEINKGNFEFIAPFSKKKGTPVRLIPHFFDPIWEEGTDDKGVLQEIELFKNDSRMLLYVGPTELDEKNFVRLEEAVATLDDSWCLLICGEVPEERLIALNTDAQCRVMSVYVSHAVMQRIYPLADQFVLPSIEEAFGIATIEAMGHGIPVLLHDSTHSRWLCADEEQCTDMSLKGAIVKYLSGIENHAGFKKLKGSRNQEYFLRTFTWEQLREQYLNILQL